MDKFLPSIVGPEYNPSDFDLDTLHWATSKWVRDELSQLNDLQKVSVPTIKGKKSTLILAPTGSGKTLAAFLGIIDSLYSLADRGVLESKIYAIYVSPLRALNNDIQKNLTRPLEGISTLVGKEKVRSAVRTGDTTPYQRTKMLKTPPHILITTPESLGILLASKKFRENFRGVEWIIIDEIHAIAENKRGVFLSLMLEKLEQFVPHRPSRIGLSATISPVEEIAYFMMGAHKDMREISLIDYGSKRELDVRVQIPVKKLPHVFFANVIEKQVNQIKEIINSHRTTIVFTNTRHWSERIGRDLMGDEKFEGKVAVHHSSMEREVRFSVEKKMKEGELKAIISTASLELGIDIGSIDVSVQVGSPKTVNRALQRIGRAGHSFYQKSKGVLLASTKEELLELAALSKLMLDGVLDDVRQITSPMDVLAQHIVGLVIDSNWHVEELIDHITSAYPYRNITLKDLNELLEVMDTPYSAEDSWKYGRIRYNKETGMVQRRGSLRASYLMNIGTIPDITSYDVVLEEQRTLLGQLSEHFAERLNSESVFILGGKSYRYLRTVGKKVIVREAFGVVPTVPSWIGEAQSRSINVSLEISNISEKAELVYSNPVYSKEEKRESMVTYLTSNYPVDLEVADQIAELFEEQIAVSHIPTRNRIVHEKFVDPSGRSVHIILSIFGLAVNLPLAHAYAKAIAKTYETNIAVSANDNGFAFICPPTLQGDLDIFSLIEDEEEFLEKLVSALEDTETFNLRFRHIAVRALMILKRTPRRELNLEILQRVVQKLLREVPADFPLRREAKREVVEDQYDLFNTLQVFRGIASGNIKEFTSKSSTPSPMTHQIVLASVEDVIVTDNKETFLFDLQRQVLSNLNNEGEVLFSPELISEYFQSKIHSLDDDEKVVAKLFGQKIDVEVPHNLLHKVFEIPAAFVWDGEILPLEHLLTRLQLLTPSTREVILREVMVYPDQSSLDSESTKVISDILRERTDLTLIEDSLIKTLRFNGPLTSKELESHINIDVKYIEEGIWSLQRKEIIIGGEFTRTQRQYLLYEDRHAISALYDNPDDLTLREIRKLRYAKAFMRKLEMGDFQSVINQTGPLSSSIEFWARSDNFQWQDLQNSLDWEEIYYVKGLGGKWQFSTPHILNLLNAGIEDGNDVDEEKNVVNALLQIGPSTIYEVADHLKNTADHIKPFLELLELRRKVGKIGNIHSKLTKYIVIPKPGISENLESLIHHLLDWHGALQLNEIVRITRMEYAKVEVALQNLRAEGRIIQKSVYEGRYIFYMLVSSEPPGELADDVILTSHSDPYLLTASGYYGRRDVVGSDELVIIYKAEIVGAIEHKRVLDYLQIVNIQIPNHLLIDENFLYKMCQQIQDLAIRIYSIRSIVVEEIRRKPPNFPENDLLRRIFVRNGFVVDVDRLVLGNSVNIEFSLKDVVETKVISEKTKNIQYTDIADMVHSQGICSMDEIINEFELSREKLAAELELHVRQNRIFYKNSHLYSPLLWQRMKEDYINLSDLQTKIIDILDKEDAGKESMIAKLRVTDEQLQKELQDLEKRSLIHQINPLSAKRIWRKSKRPSSHQGNIYEVVKHMIRKLGPITYEEIQSRFDKHLPLKHDFFVLLELARLVRSGEIHAAWSKGEGSELFYFTKSHLQILQNTARAAKLPEWSVYHKDRIKSWTKFAKQRNLYFNGVSHLLLNYGEIIACLAVNESPGRSVISDIRISIDFPRDKLVNLVATLENHLVRKGATELVIEKIYANSPYYWRELA